MARQVLILGFEGVQALDMVGPFEVFAGASLYAAAHGAEDYDVRVVSAHGAPVSTGTGLTLVADPLPDPAAPGAAVRLEYDPTQDHTDRYGRALAYVWIGDTMLNHTLVAEGWARTYVYNHQPGRHADALADAQRDAQAARAGVWGQCPR